jgi:transposase
MPSAKYPHMTTEELQQLFAEFGTWEAVALQLGLSQSGLDGLKRRLGVKGRQPSRRKKKPSVLDPFADEIIALNEKGYDCHEIRAALALPVEAEQVRRWLHKNGIVLAVNRGAQRGAKHRDWKGGRIIDKSGYVLVYQPEHPKARKTGYILEHRLAMGQHIGRTLDNREVVHHINGILDDNRIENLQLFASNAEHLAATLIGQVPNWTEDGWSRIRGPKPRRQK